MFSWQYWTKYLLKLTIFFFLSEETENLACLEKKVKNVVLFK